MLFFTFKIKPKILLLGSTIGACIRVLICILILKTPIALYVFGLVNLVDFYIRSIIYKKCLKIWFIHIFFYIS